MLNSKERFKKDLMAKNNYSMGVLNTFFRINSYIPLTPWSISPTGICQILNYIAVYKPKVVVELGSGISTIYISKLISQNNLDVTFFSVDHDLTWIEIVKNWVENEKMDGNVNFVHAPLSTTLSYKAKEISWYDEKVLLNALPMDNIDFLIIDAPPGDLKYSRAGAFIFFAKLIENGNLNYFLDDADRAEEREISELLGTNNVYHLDFAIGGKKKMNYDTTPISLFK